MKLYRVLISSLTSSFRYPNMMSSHQLSVKAVPYSTIQGLIGSATGSMNIDNLKFSYLFRYESKFFDIETIYKITSKNGKIQGYLYKPKPKNKKYLAQDGLYPTAAPFKREVLYENYLTLYLDNEDIANSFKSPHFQLLLGRSSDLAKVVDIQEVSKKIKKIDSVNLNGTILPFNEYRLPGEIYTMPKYFDTTNNIREAKEIQPFVIFDGGGKFKLLRNDKMSKFNLENWNFDKLSVKYSNDDLYFDTELNTPILLRGFNC